MTITSLWHNVVALQTGIKAFNNFCFQISMKTATDCYRRASDSARCVGFCTAHVAQQCLHTISRLVLSRLLRPAVNHPQTENIRSTHAWKTVGSSGLRTSILLDLILYRGTTAYLGPVAADSLSQLVWKKLAHLSRVKMQGPSSWYVIH